MATIFAGGMALSGLLMTAERNLRADEPSAEIAIRTAAQQFVEDFGRSDAKALAAHWTADGVYIDNEGQRYEGQQSIQQEYEKFFQTNPGAKLSIEVDSVRLVGADTAIEEGRAAVGPQPHGQPRLMSRYTAVHVKQDGKWLMADVRDQREELPPEFGQLADLDWLSGNWHGSGPNAQGDMRFQWIVNKQFLSRTFATMQDGHVTASGLEIIGVNQATGQITSWSFTSDGGHAIGYWAPHDDGWFVEYDGVMGDGTETFAVNVLTRKDDNTFQWISQDRVVGDSSLPDLGPVTITRKQSP